jgi:hypothetical protein
MTGNGLSELKGGVVAGEGDAVASCHGEVVLFPKAICRLEDAPSYHTRPEMHERGAAFLQRPTAWIFVYDHYRMAQVNRGDTACYLQALYEIE